MNAFINLAVVIIVLSSIQLWILAAIRVFSGKPLLTYEPRQDFPWGLSDILMAIFLQVAVHSVAYKWFQLQYDLSGTFEMHKLGIELGSTYVGVTALASLAGLVLIIGWLIARHRPSLGELGICFRSIGLDLLLGVRAFVMLAPVVYGIQLILVQLVVESQHPLLEMLKKNPSPRFFVMSGLAAVIVAPLVEEVFFRLLLQGWIERLAVGRDGSWRIFFGGRGRTSEAKGEGPETILPPEQLSSDAETELAPGRIPRSPTVERKLQWSIVGSALLFAAAHGSYGPDPIPLFVFALGLGYLFQATGRILPSIIVHLLLNGATLGMMWLVMREKV